MSSQGKHPTARTGAGSIEGESDTSGKDASEDAKSGEITESQAFDALRNGRRRAALSYLRTNGGSMSVTDLSTSVATEEYGVSPEELSAEQYKRVYTGLYQCHLSRLDELNIIDFDSEENHVQLREEATQLDPFLDSEPDSDSARLELAFSASVGLVVSLGILGVGPVGAVPMGLLAAMTVAALFGLALFQLA
jgi:hypothetical protein